MKKTIFITLLALCMGMSLRAVDYTYEAVRTIDCNSAVCALEKLSDGRFAAGLLNGNIQIWDPKLGRLEQTLTGHTSDICALVELSDGRLASASWGQIKIWNTKTLLKTFEEELTANYSAIHALVKLHDGRLAAGLRGAIKILNPKTLQEELTLMRDKETITALAVLPDGRLVSGSHKGYVEIWNSTTGESLLSLRVHQEAIKTIASLSDGRFAALSKRDIIFGSGGSIKQILMPKQEQESLILYATEELKIEAEYASSFAVLSDDNIVVAYPVPQHDLLLYKYGIKILNPKTRKEELTLRGEITGLWNGQNINALTILPDESIVIGINRGPIQIWAKKEKDTSCIIC